MLEQLYFYFTNDFHSNFEQWPRTANYLKKEKEKWEARGREVFLFDIGDHVDRVDEITEASLGKSNIELMNDIGYTAATIGNNEGITLPHEALFHLYDDANFPVICGNLKASNGDNPIWLSAEQSISTKHGTRIGVIGLTAAFYAFYKPLGWDVSDPYEFLDEQIASLNEQYDIIILLSHLGISEDEEIARRYPQIDIIMGGHTHHLLKNGTYENGVLLAAAGKGCFYTGAVHCEWNTEKKLMVSKVGYAEDVAGYQKDSKTNGAIAEMREFAQAELSLPIAELRVPLLNDWFQSGVLINGLADTLKRWTDADCAMLNAGLILDNLPAGVVTKGDLHRICPHPINPCVVEVDGDELLEIMRASETEELIQYKLKGFGFRGKVIGKMVFSSLEPVKEKHLNGSYFIRSAMINGEEIVPEQNYKLATADTFTFGRLFPEISKAKEKNYYLPEFLRDLLPETLRQIEKYK